MRLLDDTQWQQFKFATERMLESKVRGKRDFYARMACQAMRGDNMDSCRFNAGYSSAMEDVYQWVSEYLCEMEEKLHPYYDDEADVHQFCEEDESCDD